MKDKIIYLDVPHTSEEIRIIIETLMSNHDQSECCGVCRSLCKIYNPATDYYDRGYCMNQESEMNGSGFMDLTDWCPWYTAGVPLLCPNCPDVSDFIIRNHDYFNPK